MWPDARVAGTGAALAGAHDRHLPALVEPQQLRQAQVQALGDPLGDGERRARLAALDLAEHRRADAAAPGEVAQAELHRVAQRADPPPDRVGMLDRGDHTLVRYHVQGYPGRRSTGLPHVAPGVPSTFVAGSPFLRPDVLVLASGGTLGEAWMSGVLAGIEDATGHDFRATESLVGTSAGALIAAALVAGERPRRPRRANGRRELTTGEAGGHVASESSKRLAAQWLPMPRSVLQSVAREAVRLAGAAATPLAPMALAPARTAPPPCAPRCSAARPAATPR